jgi:hypothetical protein
LRMILNLVRIFLSRFRQKRKELRRTT